MSKEKCICFSCPCHCKIKYNNFHDDSKPQNICIFDKDGPANWVKAKCKK